MASEEMLQAITKHAMGDRSEFDALKERFKEDFDWCTNKSAVAALAYMIAKDELEEAKEEEEEPDVYDEVVEVIKNNFRYFVASAPHTAADEIFTLIYEWLDKDLEVKGFPLRGMIRPEIRARFLPFIIKKSEA